MKTLKNKLQEDLYSTPENTIGSGQVSFPSIDNSIIGSDGIPIYKRKFKKNKKSKNEKG